MGIKSTVTLSREEAESRFIDAIQRERYSSLEEFVKRMTNEELEDSLEKLNDAYYRREYNSDSGFDNYMIE